MKKYILLLIVCVLAISSFYAINAENEKEGKVQLSILNKVNAGGEARVIVVMKGSSDKSQGILSAQAAINEVGEEKIKHRFQSINGFSALLNEEDINKLAADDNVEAIYEDMPVHADLTDSVLITNASLTWRLQQNITNLTGRGQTVCIVDTGIDYTHPALGNCTPTRYALNGINETNIVQSAHNYTDNYDNTWTITKAGYSKIAVHFVNISLEPSWSDRIVIYNSNMKEIASYHGNVTMATDIWTPYSDGNTIYVRLITDESTTYYGFYIDQVRNGTTNTTYNWNGCPKVIGGWDFVNNDGDPMDDYGHGTHVAGIVAANGTITGVAPEAKLVAAKALDSSGSGYTSDIASAIEFCTNISEELNISVISMSLGSLAVYTTYCADYSSNLSAASINMALAKGISVVVATGNSASTTGISSPACVRNATRVAATNKDDTFASAYANRNSLIMLVAPGTSITSTYLNGASAVETGTSMATPHVAGAIAIMREYLSSTGQTKTPQQIELALNNTGRRIADTGTGLNFSRINIYNAIISLDINTPNVSLISPATNYLNNTATTLNLTFRCNASDLSLKNITFFLWNSSNSIYNSTTAISAGSAYTLEVNVTNITQGSYKWNCLAYDENGNSAIASSNFTANYTNRVQMSVLSPANNSWYNAIKFNVSLQDQGLCWFSLDNGANVTMQNTSSTAFYNMSSSITQTSSNAGHNATFYCNNSAGILNISSRIFFGIDKSVPNVSIESPNSSYSATGTTSIDFKYNVSDSINLTNCALIINGAIDSYNSSTITNSSNTITKSVSAGSYTWSINCTDEAGNTGNSSSTSLTINAAQDNAPAPSGGGGGGGGGGTTGNTYVITTEQTAEGFSRELAKDDKMRFELTENAQSESHTLSVNSVSADKVEITIASNPIKLSLSVGQEAKLNLTSMSYYDLYVKLEGIAGSKANITLKTINEPITQVSGKTTGITGQVSATGNANANTTTTTTNSNPGSNTNGSSALIYIIIAVSAIIIIAVIIVVYRMRKDK